MKKTILCLLLALGLLLMSAAAMADSDPSQYLFDIGEGNITIEKGTEAGTLKVLYGNGSKVDNISSDTTINVWGRAPTNSPKLIINATVPVTINYYVECQGDSRQSSISIADNADVTLTVAQKRCDAYGTSGRPGIALGSGSKLTINGDGSTQGLYIYGGQSAILGPGSDETPATVILNSGIVRIHSGSDSGISGNVNLVINGGTVKANNKPLNVQSLIVTGGELWAGDSDSTKVTYDGLKNNPDSYSNIHCTAGILPHNLDAYGILTFFGDLTLPLDLTIQKPLGFVDNATLTIPTGRNMTFSYDLSVCESNIITNNGTLTLNESPEFLGKLVNNGTLYINNTVVMNPNGDITGTLTNTGTISGSGRILPQECRASQSQPSLTVDSIENGTVVTLSVPANANATAQYSLDKTKWQDEPEFTGGIPDAGQTFYARYKENNFFKASGDTSITVFPVSLNANDGTIASGKDVTYYIAKQGKPLPTEDDTIRENYSFAGWYANEDLTGDAVTAIGATDTGKKTFWAKWTPDTYTVTLDANGGTIGSGNVTGYTYGEGATLPTDVTRAGYTFAGWYDNEALTGDAVTEITKDATGEKKYWAKWRIVLTDPDGAIVSGDAAFAKLPPVKVPTLVLPEGVTLGSSVTLKYVKVATTRENTAIYDVYLVDQDGNIVKLPEACTLCLPYPEGMDAASRSAYRIHILHEMDGGRSEDFDSVSGGLELTAQGLCVRISSLSPFTITWERFPEVNLPQTGDSSRLAVWLALLGACCAGLWCVSRRRG